MIPAAAKLNRAETSSTLTANIHAAAARTTLLPELPTSAHDSVIHASELPVISNIAKGKEKLQLRPALANKTSQNPNPVAPILTQTLDPNTLPETHAQQPPQTQAQIRNFI